MSVKEINSDEDFSSVVRQAAGKMILIDFSASWCGPCKAIAPVLNELAAKHADLVFLKVDVDKCPQTARIYNISAMPTFVFEKDGKVIETFKGANPATLREKVESVSNMAATAVNIGGSEFVDLAQFITEKSCLNEDEEHPFKWVFEDDEHLYLESDCDEELLMSFSFSQQVKLHSIKIKAPDDGTGPKELKLYINQPSNMDFDGARDGKAIQEITLTKDDISGGDPVKLKYVKLQAVNNVTLFVKSNQGDEDTTKIQNIVFYGKTVSTTNMSQFQRVAGKAGESH